MVVLTREENHLVDSIAKRRSPYRKRWYSLSCCAACGFSFYYFAMRCPLCSSIDVTAKRMKTAYEATRYIA